MVWTYPKKGANVWFGNYVTNGLVPGYNFSSGGQLVTNLESYFSEFPWWV